MEAKKFKYLNGFNTINDKQFTYLKEYLKDSQDRNIEMPSSPRLIFSSKNVCMIDNDILGLDISVSNIIFLKIT